VTRQALHKLRQCLSEVFGPGAVQRKTSLRKKGRTFSFKADDRGEAVLLDLDQAKNFPPEAKRCDGMLVWWTSGAKPALIVLIECKHGQSGSAEVQIQATYDSLCRKSAESPHDSLVPCLRQMSARSRASAPFHVDLVLGLVLAGKSISGRKHAATPIHGRQVKRKKRPGLRVRVMTGSRQLKPSDLEAMLAS